MALSLLSHEHEEHLKQSGRLGRPCAGNRSLLALGPFTIAACDPVDQLQVGNGPEVGNGWRH